MITLADLNRMPAQEFVQTLAGVFEHSPWVAAGVAAGRPFASLHLLHAAMCAAVEAAGAERQLALIRAHPRLGLRGRARSDLTRASAAEQQGAGLDAVPAGDLARLDELNQRYADKFSMPFVISVRGHTPASIIAACELRLGNDPDTEQRTALREIGVIAGHRLGTLLSDTGP